MPNPFGPLFGDDWFVDESARIVVTEAGVFPLPTTEGGPTLLGGIAEAAAETSGRVASIVFVAGTAEAAAEADGTALTTSVAFVGWGIPVGI